ncbi:hypothetical protein A3K63_03335 [Candidatus Micrarchaeota archaeon RBG_16_49_10]|nr:MAG: hypothetical protein A3K63_03335 [Candidatus Micrarchaeota archaeon RBG_16_49_10]
MTTIYVFTEVRSVNIIGAPPGVPNTSRVFNITGPKEAEILIYATQDYPVAVEEVERLEKLPDYQIIRDTLPVIGLRLPDTRYLSGLVR